MAVNVPENVSSTVFVERDAPRSKGRLAQLWSTWRRKPFGALGGILIIAFLFIAIAAPLLAPYQPNVFSGPTLHEPSPKHPFGTDNLGRDTMSRVIYGAQISLAAGLTASIIATGIGALF